MYIKAKLRGLFEGSQLYNIKTKRTPPPTPLGA